jgi:cupin superfamily acireductone dioxygenase involved in methionine salvage
VERGEATETKNHQHCIPKYKQSHVHTGERIKPCVDGDVGGGDGGGDGD